MTMDISAEKGDIDCCYAVLLGRPCESTSIYSATVGQSLTSVFRKIMDSEEFRLEVCGRLRHGLAFRDGRFSSPLTQTVRSWLEHRSPLAATSQRWLSLAEDWFDVHATILLDGVASEQAFVSQAQRDLSQHDGADLVNLYHLILRREIESASIQTEREAWPIRKLIAVLFSSREFYEETVLAIISGRLTDLEVRAGSRVSAWLKDRFGLEIRETASHGELLAALLRSDYVQICSRTPSSTYVGLPPFSWT